jgi:hypothetical protein
MKLLTACIGLAVLAPVARAASPAEEAAADHLGRLIHSAIAQRIPPVFEDHSGWGRTVPPPERMRLPRLRRAAVEVDGRLEVPDGPWHRFRVRVEDPNRDVHVHVRSFQRVDVMTFRVVVEIDAAARAEADVQAWRNGLLLADLTAPADVGLAALVECDVAARLEPGRFPPRVALEPQVRDLKLNLTEFTPRQVLLRRAGVAVEGEPLAAAGEQVRGPLQDRLHALEPMARTRVEDLLRRVMKAGADPSRAGAMLKAIAPLLREK